MFDDTRLIVENVRIRRWWPPWEAMSGTTRPVVMWSLAVNDALGGREATGYHVVNLAIHLLTALVLYGLFRRLFAHPRFAKRYGSASSWLACSAALLWVVHPLTTQAVTYLIQRAESLMALCYVCTLYALMRSAEAAHPRRWQAAAIAACAVGMASKPVMVSAPLMALALDRYVLAGSWRDVWRRHRGVHLGLMATWAILAWLLLSAPADYQETAGYGARHISVGAYLRTQPGVILQYLRLAVWPHPLVLDYGWPIASTAREIALPAAIVLGMAWGIWRALRRGSLIGVCGAWTLVGLLPSSSVIPIADVAFEHRMYLPLAGIMAMLVLAVGARLRRSAAIALMIAAVAALGLATIDRNRVYASEEAIWRDAVQKRPLNPRAHNNLGAMLLDHGRLKDALQHLHRAVALDPQYAGAYDNLGLALAKQGRLEEAIARYHHAIRLNPHEPETHNNLGLALLEQGKPEEAIAEFRAALAIHPHAPRAHYNLGLALAKQGRLEDAVAHYRRHLELEPQSAEGHNNLGAALIQQGALEQAASHFAAAVALDARNARAHNNLGNALIQQGRYDEALAHYREALRLEPDFAEARANLEAVLRRRTDW